MLLPECLRAGRRLEAGRRHSGKCIGPGVCESLGPESDASWLNVAMPRFCGISLERRFCFVPFMLWLRLKCLLVVYSFGFCGFGVAQLARLEKLLAPNLDNLDNLDPGVNVT